MELQGERFGRLVVVEQAKPRGKYRPAWVCRCDCGNVKEVSQGHLRSGRTTSCGCYHREQSSKSARTRRGEAHPTWKGGKSKSRQGYIRLREQVNGKRRYLTEHRVVMEKHLGRPLTKRETVHHKNGVRDDNRLENLELRASHHGPGQSVEDKIRYAVEVLREYAPDLLTSKANRV